MDKVTRRTFVTTAVASSLVPAPVWFAKSVAAQPPLTASGAWGHSAYLFFDAAEAQFIEAACERLIPADQSGPGALGAGVSHYLDAQLGGSWGAGERLYRCGAWQPGTPSVEVQLPFAPAEFFRSVLRAINLGFETCGRSFTALPCQDQDAFLAALESGGTHLGERAAVFFDMLLKMTVEGFFSHPLYGKTRDRVAWRMVGFPGAYGAAS